MRFFLSLLIFLNALSVQAALYKYKDKNGEIIYSDHPPYPGAEAMTPPKLQTQPALKIKPKPKAEPVIKEKDIQYHKLSLLQPKSGETIRENNGNVPVSIDLAPSLDTKNGHYINFYLDGKIVKKHMASLSITLNNVDRGTHNVKAEIRNKNGKRLRASATHTFYLHRFSILHNQKPEADNKNPTE